MCRYAALYAIPPTWLPIASLAMENIILQFQYVKSRVTLIKPWHEPCESSSNEKTFVLEPFHEAPRFPQVRFRIGRRRGASGHAFGDFVRQSRCALGDAA